MTSGQGSRFPITTDELRSPAPVPPGPLLADTDQLLVAELVCPVPAELATEARALRPAERQLGSVGHHQVDVDHPGVDLVRDALGLLLVRRHEVRAESVR